MNISIAIYSFDEDKVYIKTPYKIVKETECCYFTDVKNGKGHHRYLKSEIGKPVLKSTKSYPYIVLVMVDADEKILREELSKWFSEKAFRIWRMFAEDNDVNENK